MAGCSPRKFTDKRTDGSGGAPCRLRFGMGASCLPAITGMPLYIILRGVLQAAYNRSRQKSGHSPVNPEIKQTFILELMLHDVFYYAGLVVACPILRSQNEGVDQFSGGDSAFRGQAGTGNHGL